MYIVNGKETILYKGVYCLAGKEELFHKVSESLRLLDPLQNLEYKRDLEITLKEPISSKAAKGNEEKKRLQKENDDHIKSEYKRLKKEFANEFKKFDILPHTMNDNIIDSIIMQIVSNFKEENNPKIKRPYDTIFNPEYKYVGISLHGKKKLSGAMIFAA